MEVEAEEAAVAVAAVEAALAAVHQALAALAAEAADHPLALARRDPSAAEDTTVVEQHSHTAPAARAAGEVLRLFS